MDLDEVAAELYALLPEEFTSTRNLKEKEARAAGDKALATQIHALAKPNQVAWMANQLTRHHASEIEPLVALGAELREAADGLTPEQLREFSRQQRQLVGALVVQAKQLALAQGKKVSGDTAQGLQTTLQAALADPEAAERLMAGRLVEGMQHVGFGPGASAPVRHLRAVPERGRDDGAGPQPRSAAPKKDKRERDIERADQDVVRAEAIARDAVEMRDDAENEWEKADRAATDLDAQVARLRDKLERVESDQARAIRDLRRLRAGFERAEKVAADAVRRLQLAQTARQRVTGDE